MRYAGLAALSLAVLMTVGLIGCQGSSEEAGAGAEGMAGTESEAAAEAGQGQEETAPDLAAEAATMSPEELQAKIDELTSQIEEKEGELKEITEKLKALAPADLAGDTGRQLQAESDTLTEEINSLKEKVHAWTDAGVE